MARPERTLPAWLPHWEENAWWERYWQDVRPRLVLVRIKVERIDIRWGVPLWALEESLRFVLLTLPWVAYGWRYLPARWRSAWARPDRRARIVIEPLSTPPWASFIALLEGHGSGMMRLESGEPFVSVEAGDGARRVLVEITQF